MQDQEHARPGEPVRGSGFNRRDFLRGSGAAMAATALATAGESAAAAETPAAVIPAQPTPVTINVNGTDRTLTLEPRVTLLEALRIDLNLTGCKDVCDTTNCGACTVLLDGKPVYACAISVHAVGKKKVTTVEGLASGPDGKPVISAFVKHDATQCGYCTPGFVMAVRGFCAKHPGATREEVLKGLGGNICRCGTYAGVAAAAFECAHAQQGGG